MMKDEEIEKVNSREIKELEKTLNKINNEEEKLLEEFDKNIFEILGDIATPLLEQLKNETKLDELGRVVPILENLETRNVNGYNIPKNFLLHIHKSLITNQDLKIKYETRLKEWFTKKTNVFKELIKDKNTSKEVNEHIPEIYALASLALSSFHNRQIRLYDVQKLTGIVISEGNIAELGTGEGKTLSAILPIYLQALRGKGAHVITANSYLSKRDYEETKPIYEGLGLTTGFVPENIQDLIVQENIDASTLSQKEQQELREKLKLVKKNAYYSDITYGSKTAIAFDYLRDNIIYDKDDMVERPIAPGFALIDEVDDVLVDDAQIPYKLARLLPMYKEHMTLLELCTILDEDYEKTLSKVKENNLNLNDLTYEEANYICETIFSKELLPDQKKFQEIAQRFFNTQKVLVTKDNMLGLKTSKELYDALLDGDKYDVSKIIEEYGIIYCPETKEYKISDKCYEKYLEYVYFATQFRGAIRQSEEKIKKDNNYEEGTDYSFDSKNHVRLTTIGINKILQDKNYDEIIDDYNQFMTTVTTNSSAVIHYFTQAVVANLIMEKGKEYIVDNDEIKVLKNSRIQENSTFSFGLHQALEIKEKVPYTKRTNETESIATITQKDFYQRYDAFSGMTGTSSKEIFSDIFGKQTISIPRNSFYSYYKNTDRKTQKEPIGVTKKDTIFSLEQTEKISLIINSILESQKQSPKQPVLIVVENPKELELIHEKLKEINLDHNVLSATTEKSNEAEIIAKAGLPGSITLSTEMAGRGTDIRLGGDRDTLIEIALERHIKYIEARYNKKCDLSVQQKEILRKKVETALMNSKTINFWSMKEQIEMKNSLETIGLKVISSGFFQRERIDRQLEGRTGRNGISGICERFVCADDLKRIGVKSVDRKTSLFDYFSKFPKNNDGTLKLDKKSYKEIHELIEKVQSQNEKEIKERISSTQKLDSVATKLIEKYREERRKILCDQTNVDKKINAIIENATDGIITSYIQNQEIGKNDLLKPILDSKLELNMEAIALEIKSTLGISIDLKEVYESKMNLLEFRNAIIRTSNERLKATATLDDYKKVLLIVNDYMIAKIPEVLEQSFTSKRLTSLSMGMESQVEYRGSKQFAETHRKLQIESSKVAIKNILGVQLTINEQAKLSRQQKHSFEYNVEKSDEENFGTYEIKKPICEKDNNELVGKLRKINEKISEKNDGFIARIAERVEKFESKEKQVDYQHMYKNIRVRPFEFVKTLDLLDENDRLVLVRHPIDKSSDKSDRKGESLH